MYFGQLFSKKLNQASVRVCLGLVAWLLALPAVGQPEPMEFGHLSVDQGLSHGTVYAIAKDAQGFMWFGSRNGLNKYDARRIRIYRNLASDTASLANNSIFSLLSDSKGRLWVGTGAGLNLYNPVQDNFTRIRISPSPEKAGHHVQTLLEDRDHNIWVGTARGLFVLRNGNPGTIDSFMADSLQPNSLPNSEVRKIIQDREGVLWIGTTNGLSRLVYRGGQRVQFQNYYLPLCSPKQKNYNWINALAEDQAGRIWVGTEKSGLHLFDKSKGAFVALPAFEEAELTAGKIRVLQVDKRGVLWVGSIGGLFALKPGTGTFTKYTSNPQQTGALSDHSIRSHFIDENDMHWVGTFFGGVNYYSPLARQFGSINLRDLYQGRFKVTGKMVTDERMNLWVSTEGAGLFYLDNTSGEITNYRHTADRNSLSHDNIKSILPERGGLWIGTLHGLDFLDLKTGTFSHLLHNPTDKTSLPDDNVYALKRDRRGRLWVGTYHGGLGRLDEETKTFSTLSHNPRDTTSLSSDGITYLYEDADQTLWVGTTNGLNRKDPHQDTFTRYFNKPAEEQSQNYILSIYEDAQKQLWVGTQSGLYLLNKETGAYRYLTTADGLPANTIYGILEDEKGYMWISTQNGLARYHPPTSQFQTYNKEDGLISKEFNFNSFHHDAAGRMYFGGYDGVVVFHPDSIVQNTQGPQLRFTHLRLYNQDVVVQGPDGLLTSSINSMDRLTFRHNQNIFSVGFAVLNFINPRKNQFAYQLQGFDGGWNHVTDPVASYMNLPPGDYTLLVKGSNNDGVWGPVQAMPITILPPPWRTWWAYMFYVALFLGVLYTWSRVYKTRLNLTHQLDLEHLEHLRQEELHQSKIEFFSNVAHELRTPLTLIVSPVQLLRQKYRQDPFLHHQLSVVSSNTDRLLRLLNQLLDFNKQEEGIKKLRWEEQDLVAWLREIRASFEEHARRCQVELHLETDQPEILMEFDPEELEKVFFNLLSNAFKFTPAQGCIRLGLRLDRPATPEHPEGRPQVAITVEDDGLGIAAAHLPHVFDRYFQAENKTKSSSGFGIGLALAKDIVRLHGGTISVASQERLPGQSGFTRFTVLLPLHQPEVALTRPASLKNSPGGADSPEVRESALADEVYTQLLELEKTAQATIPDSEKVTVLLVEDNAEIREYLKSMLSSHYFVKEAADGAEGWEIARELLPNLVISDVSMPRMDGFELTRQLKSDERTDHIPVILLTARGTLPHQLEGLELGADEYMSKPFNIQLLLLKVRNLLATREKLKERFGRILALQPQYQEVESPEDKFLQRLMLLLETNISDPDFNVAELVKQIGMSRPVLFRKTKMLTGLSVIDLIRSLRLKKAEMLLKQNKLNISQVAYEVGYNDPKYFSKIFRSQYGKSPTEYVEALS